MNRVRSPLKVEALQLLRNRQVEVGTVLDVGVQHGTPELLEAYPEVHHVLFEPVEEYFSTIRNVYRDSSFELVKSAVSDESGAVTLKVKRRLKGMDISHSTMVFESEDDTEDFREVPMIRLDEFVLERDFTGPFLLKIDIDGHEMRVLRGAEEVLKKCNIVIVECVHNALPARVDFLQKRGFRLFDLVEPAYYDGVFWQCDAIFIKNEVFANTFEDLMRVSKITGAWTVFR